MADCGTTGSALDRATRILGGVGSTNAAVDGGGLATLLTAATNTRTAFANVLPAAPPEYMPQLPSSLQECQFHQEEQGMIARPERLVQQTAAATSAGLLNPRQPASLLQTTSHQQVHHHAQQQQASMIMQQQQLRQPTAAMRLTSPQLHPPSSMMMMMMQMQQQQALMGAMLQHQQQMKLQQQQQTNGSIGNAEIGVEGSARPVSIAELAQAWNDVVTDDDRQQPQGATPASIDELSKAWWEANATGEDWQAAMADELGEYDNDYGLDQWGNPEQYEFQNKPLSNMNEPIKDWLEEGMRHFKVGDLVEAIHAFEMELQLNSAENAEAWLMLGKCHAEQDMDREAILCLVQSVEVDPYNVHSRLALGVSYVNELDHGKALEQLKAWVTHNPHLTTGTNNSGTMPPMEDIYGDGTSTPSPFDEVQQLLLHALESTTGKDDHTTLADIYTALGVVYNVSRDYDAAIDAFRTALSHRPDDYQLYNKLGATMANHNQSDRALEQYRRALAIKPKYARAWLNTAISHSNLHQYEDSSRSYLQTLSLTPKATHCWSYLRVSINCAERHDLIPLVVERNLTALRSAFGMPNE